MNQSNLDKAHVVRMWHKRQKSWLKCNLAPAAIANIDIKPLNMFRGTMSFFIYTICFLVCFFYLGSQIPSTKSDLVWFDLDAGKKKNVNYDFNYVLLLLSVFLK